ncbi:MAG: serine/threonine-protein kinase [Cyanobacteria bacterium P01_A01_bin.114]
MPPITFDTRYKRKNCLSKKPGRQTHLGLDLNTQSPVIIKILAFTYDFDWSWLKLFQREATVLQSLDHPAIPKYLDHFEIDTPEFKGFGLVQSYVDANSLEEHVRAGRTFDTADIRHIATEMLKILSYLHGRHPAIVHRDVKPSNILLRDRTGNSRGQLHLVDFGSVQNVATVEGDTLTIAGTYGYAAPEQFSGHASVASDLYGLGATLVYLLTGQHPADLPTRQGRLYFEDQTTLDPHLSRWIATLLAPDPNQRFANAQEALSHLQRVDARGLIELPRRKPADSRIRLSKTDNELNITIFARGLSKSRLLKAFLITLFSIPFLVLMLFPLVGSSIVATMIFQSLRAWQIFFFQSFGKTHLNITPKYITLTNRCFGFYRRRRSAAINIIKLQREQHHIYKYKDSEGDTVSKEYPASVAVWAGNRAYQLGNPLPLTNVELDWLTSEMSSWLNLPVEGAPVPIFSGQQSQTSKVTPAPVPAYAPEYDLQYDLQCPRMADRAANEQTAIPTSKPFSC